MEQTIMAGPGVEPAMGYDHAAWQGLEELREGLRAYLVRLCTDENDLDDTIQETFLRAARYRHQHRVRNLRPWLMRIAQNVLADGRRRQARSGTTVKSGEPLDVPESVECVPGGMRIAGGWFEREAACALVQHALARLRRDDHALLAGHYLEPRAGRAASEVGATRPARKTRLYRARRRLRTVVCREAGLHLRLGLAS